MNKHIGLIGLGKMGGNLARQLLSKDWRVVGYNRTVETAKEFETEYGLEAVESLADLVKALPSPRVIWVMVPAGDPVQQVILGEDGLISLLEKDDIVIDGGNSFYKHSQERFEKLSAKGIHFLDAGVSGGPDGALNGACVMVGGKLEVFTRVEDLFKTISLPDGYAFFEGPGAGHFVKMVHNGIEYGMMQAIAEGFDIMRSNPDYELELKKVANVYNHGSVIESRLMQWMEDAFHQFGDNLDSISGSAGQGGGGAGEVGKSEAAWTVDVAHEFGVDDEVIHEALTAREESRDEPSYQGKIINALRNQFGGHDFS